MQMPLLKHVYTAESHGALYKDFHSTPLNTFCSTRHVSRLSESTSCISPPPKSKLWGQAKVHTVAMPDVVSNSELWKKRVRVRVESVGTIKACGISL